MSRVKSLFGRWTQELQFLVDTNMDALKEPFFPKYFRMGSPKNTLTYATAIGRSRIEAAASVVEHGSEAPLRSRAGLELLTGKIASIKVKRKMDEQEYRDWLALQNLSTLDDNAKNQAIQLIWEDVKYVADSVSQRIDIMAAQALSKGVVTIDATTNPDGVVHGDIDLLVKNKVASNSAFGYTGDADRLWTLAKKATATPIADIQHLTRKAWREGGVKFSRILMTPEKFWIMQACAEVQNLLKGFTGITNGEFNPSLGNINAYLAANDLPVIELVDVRAMIETNGKLAAIDAWADKKYITFVPDGDLGIIHNAFAIEQIAPVPNVDYAVANNTLISKWSQTEPFGEYTRGELAAFPGLEAADYMYIVNTENQTTFG